jgi:hypothetical protein
MQMKMQPHTHLSTVNKSDRKVGILSQYLRWTFREVNGQISMLPLLGKHLDVEGRNCWLVDLSRCSTGGLYWLSGSIAPSTSVKKACALLV